MGKLLIITAIIASVFSCSNRISGQNATPEIGQFEKNKQFKTSESLFYLKSQGDQIFYRKCGNPLINRYDHIILIIHGIGYHSLPYLKIENTLYDDSVLVYAMDLRGHGLSGGEKGILDSNDKILSDIDNMIDKIKTENPDSKIYLLGSSMGGAYALGYVIREKFKLKISGLILVGPAIQVHKSRIIRLGFLKLLWLSVFNDDKPAIRIDGRVLEKSSRDPAWIYSRRNDPRAINHISVAYLKELHEMQEMDKRKTELAQINLPVLIQHGGKDKIISIKGSYHLKENLKNAKTKLVVYPESYHTLFWDNDSSRVFNDIAYWIKEN